jgi:hypothetical protein
MKQHTREETAAAWRSANERVAGARARLVTAEREERAAANALGAMVAPPDIYEKESICCWCPIDSETETCLEITLERGDVGRYYSVRLRGAR